MLRFKESIQYFFVIRFCYVFSVIQNKLEKGSGRGRGWRERGRKERASSMSRGEWKVEEGEDTFIHASSKCSEFVFVARIA